MAWKYRQVQIEDDLAVADSGTKTFDIKIKDPLTALTIRFKARNGASAVKETPPELNITKIELIDGGQVYWALNGPMAVGASVYGLGRWPHSWYDERANNNQRINFPLMFGRYLGDEVYAFTPTRLTNPQLKITWADVAGYLDNYITIGLTAQVMEGLPGPMNMLNWMEVEPWVTASSGEHKVELPIDFTIRALMMRPYATGGIWNTIWTNFKLDCDMGKFIPFNLNQHEFRDLMIQEFGPYLARYFLVATNNEQKEAWLGEVFDCQGSHQTTPPGITALYSSGWPVFFTYIADHAGGALTDALVQASASGYYPHTCLLWPFGRWMDPATWFNPRAEMYSSVDLKITEAVASADARVAVQQVRPLP